MIAFVASSSPALFFDSSIPFMYSSFRCLSLLALLCATSFSVACSRDNAKGAVESSAAPKPSASAIDSALPREVELERFRAGLGAEVTELSNGFGSRDSLMDAFLKRLAARDTARLGELGLTKAEFAWIYYPSSPMGKPPYDLSPGLMYFQFDGNNRKGFVHLLEDRGGKDLKVVGYSCAAPEKQETNTVYTQCLVKRLQAPGDTLTELLFGGIIEHNGKYKLLNFANKF
ncbi:MAG: hypothetical protein ABI852_11870 [Gemmatimonadaceae bacterium]